MEERLERHTVVHEERTEKLWTKKFVLLTLCNLLLFLNLQMMTPSFPAYVTERFHASDFTVSLVISLFALSAVIARIFTGKALETKKSMTILLIGLGLVTLATIGYVWSGSIAMLLLMRVVFGAGFGMTSTTFPTLASNIVPAKRMGEGMGYFGLSSSLAMSIAPVIGLWILGQYGFITLSVSAIALVVVILPLLWLIQSDAAGREMRIRQIGAEEDRADALIPAVSSNQHPAEPDRGLPRIVWLPAFLNLLLGITYGGLISFLALFGKEVNIDNVGWFFLCNAGAMLLGLIASATSYAVMYTWSSGCMILFLVIYLSYQLLFRRVRRPAAKEEIGA